MKKNSLWPHRLSIGVAFSTLFLIFVGALVTSTDSGLAVPDWPLSYGRLMPPMIGGIFYEHGHRMVATFVGFLTIILALVFTFKEDRKWLRRLAWGALALVIFQGILGGLTVLLRLPRPISILHACTAQTFLSLIVAMAVWTSGFWKKEPTPIVEKSVTSPLHQIALTFFITCYVQLIFGAILRHTGWALILHIAGAVVVTVLSTWLTIRSKKVKSQEPRLFQWSLVTSTIVYAQIILGLSTYFILGHKFSVIPIPFYATLTVSFHVVTGAAVLALSVMIALMTFRRKGPAVSPKGTKMADYFELTKPGITFTAGITALAGFVLGSKGDINLLQLLHTGIGTVLISAGAGTLNMLIEKDTDARMKRTKRRPLPSGRLHSGEALFLGTFLSVISLVYFSWAVNFLTAFIAGLTLSVYLYVYTPLKKVTSFCTTVGAVAGALPPVIGWTAATGKLGFEAWILFGILFFWQFPHFFSLAWLYKDDYKQAGLHMLPRVEDNGSATAVSILLNSVALLLISLVPSFMGMTGIFYLITALGLGLWMTVASALFFKTRSTPIARKLFFASLVYVPLLVVAMVLNKAPLL